MAESRRSESPPALAQPEIDLRIYIEKEIKKRLKKGLKVPTGKKRKFLRFSVRDKGKMFKKKKIKKENTKKNPLCFRLLLKILRRKRIKAKDNGISFFQ